MKKQLCTKVTKSPKWQGASRMEAHQFRAIHHFCRIENSSSVVTNFVNPFFASPFMSFLSPLQIFHLKCFE
jgi:hypothetical protein